MQQPDKPSARRQPSAEEVLTIIEEKALDLTEAIRILRHAGRPDPTQFEGGPVRRLQAIIDGLCDLSMHDGLTGLVNATFFHAVLSQEIARSARTGRACCVMVIDADHFKLVNDNYGHHVGDYALQTLAGKLRQSLRMMDTAARIGGEEFAVILPECGPGDAVRAGTRIHAVLNPFVVNFDGGTLSLTTSAGLVWSDAARAANSLTLLDQADQQMYRAKQAGRACLRHPPLPPTPQSQVSQLERGALTAGRSRKGPK